MCRILYITIARAQTLCLQFVRIFPCTYKHIYMYFLVTKKLLHKYIYTCFKKNALHFIYVYVNLYI